MFDKQAALNAGYTPQQVQAYMQQNNLQEPTSTPAPSSNTMPSPGNMNIAPTGTVEQMFQSDSQRQSPSSYARQQPSAGSGGGFWDGLVDWLPTIGAVGGGLLGTAVAPGVGSVTGAGAGGALGETVKEAIQGKPLNAGNIALQGGMGAIGEGVGGLVAKGVGKGMEALGNTAAMNGLNITRLSQGKFASQFGEPISKVLQDNGIAGTDREGLMNHISNIQDQFNNIANANVNIDPNSVTPIIKNYAEKFLGSPVSSVRAVGQKMLSEIQGLQGRYPNGMTLGDLNGIRQAFDKATTDAQFGSDNWGVNRAMGQMLRDSVRSAASDLEGKGLLPNGGTLSDIGQKLNKLYDIADRSAGREASGGGGSPFSVTNLLAEMGGGGAAAFMGGNPILGGLAGFAARKIISNPAVARVLSPGLTSAGQAVGSGISKGIGGAIGAATGTGVAGGLQQPQFSGGQPAIGGGTAGLTTPPAGVTKDPSTGAWNLPPLQATGVSQIYTPQAYAQDMAKASGDPVTQSQLTEIFKASQDSANSYIDKNGLSPDEQENMRNAYNTNYLANQVRIMVQQTPPGFLGKFKDFQQLESYNNGQYAALGTALQRLQAEVGKQLQGGVLRGYDINVLSVTPQLGDSPDAAQAKLDQVQSLLSQQYMNLYGKYGLNTQTPATQNAPGNFATPGQ